MGGRGSKYTTAGEIVGDYGLTDITDSKAKIVSFFRDVDRTGGIQLDWDRGKIQIKKDASQKVRELVDELSERMVERDEDSLRDYREIRQMLNGAYYLSDQDKRNIPDFTAYARSKDNFLRIRRDGMNLDTAYNELAERYPQYFDAYAVTNPADQLQDINNVLSTLKNSTRQLPREDRRYAADEMRVAIIKGYAKILQGRGRKKSA